MGNEDEQYSRQQYLLMRAMLRGANYEAAFQSVTDAIGRHPEWDMTERRTYRQWEDGRGD